MMLDGNRLNFSNNPFIYRYIILDQKNWTNPEVTLTETVTY
jgi:hypothetical protein